MKIKLPTSVLQMYLSSVEEWETTAPDAYGMFLSDDFESLFEEGKTLTFVDGSTRTIETFEVATRLNEKPVLVWFEEFEEPQAFSIFGVNITPEVDSPNLPDLCVNALYGNVRESKYHTSN